MKNRAVFIDRDGTLNVEKNYLFKKEDFEFTENAPKGIKLLNDNGFKVIVITNQAGVARGYYSESDVIELHKYIDEKLKDYDAKIDAYYYCPHHPIHGIGDYKINCNCRKPSTGMLDKAIKEFQIDRRASWMIGDKKTDIFAGAKAKLETILVRTGYGNREVIDNEICMKNSLYEAVKYIISLD